MSASPHFDIIIYENATKKKLLHPYLHKNVGEVLAYVT